jgi:hypothetical protein
MDPVFAPLWGHPPCGDAQRVLCSDAEQDRCAKACTSLRADWIRRQLVVASDAGSQTTTG